MDILWRGLLREKIRVGQMTPFDEPNDVEHDQESYEAWERNQLVARAIELCKAKIDEWQKTVKFLVVSKDNYAETELRSWQTHLAELEELTGSHDYYHDKVHDLTHEGDCGLYDLELKAKRLLGEE